jgi:hypothetical protein
MMKAGEVEAAVHAALKDKGFTKRGATFNRAIGDGLVHVIQVQRGQRTLQGQLTVNLGTYVPEVAEMQYGEPPPRFVVEPLCCVRTRLGVLGPERNDVWWPVAGAAVAVDVVDRLQRDGLPFLARFASRDDVVTRLDDDIACGRPSIIKAIIVAKRGDVTAARDFLLPLARVPAHAQYVRELAEKLGVSLTDPDLDPDLDR